MFCRIGGAMGKAPAAMVVVGRVTVGRAGWAIGVAGLGTRTLGLLVATAVGTGFNGAKAPGSPGTGGSGVDLRMTTFGAVLVGATEGSGELLTLGSGADGGAT